MRQSMDAYRQVMRDQLQQAVYGYSTTLNNRNVTISNITDSTNEGDS